MSANVFIAYYFILSNDTFSQVKVIEGDKFLFPLERMGRNPYVTTVISIHVVSALDKVLLSARFVAENG